MYLYPRGNALSTLVNGDVLDKIQLAPVSFVNCPGDPGDNLVTFVNRLLGTFNYQGFRAIAVHVRLGIDGLYYTTLEVATTENKTGRQVGLNFGYRSVINEHGYVQIQAVDLAKMASEDLAPPAIMAEALFANKWNYSKRSTLITLDLDQGYNAAGLAKFDNVEFPKDFNGTLLVRTYPSVFGNAVLPTVIAKANIKNTEDEFSVLVVPERTWLDSLRTLGLHGMIDVNFGFNGVTLTGGSTGKYKFTEIASAQITVIVLPEWVEASMTLTEDTETTSESPEIERETHSSYTLREQCVNSPRLYPIVGKVNVLDALQSTVSTPVGDLQYGWLGMRSFNLHNSSQVSHMAYAVQPDVTVVAVLLHNTVTDQYVSGVLRNPARFEFSPEHREFAIRDEDNKCYRLIDTEIEGFSPEAQFKGEMRGTEGRGWLNASLVDTNGWVVLGWLPKAYACAERPIATVDEKYKLAEHLHDAAYGTYVAGMCMVDSHRTREEFLDTFTEPCNDFRTAVNIARGRAATDTQAMQQEKETERADEARSETLMMKAE